MDNKKKLIKIQRSKIFNIEPLTITNYLKTMKIKNKLTKLELFTIKNVVKSYYNF